MQDKPNMCREQRKGYVDEEGGGEATGITRIAMGCQDRRGICSSHGLETLRVREVDTEVVTSLGELHPGF